MNRNFGVAAVVVACLLGCGGKGTQVKPASAVDTVAAAPDTATTFTDKRDGQVYRIVRVGGQTWFAENLNYAAEGSKCYGEDGRVWVSRYKITTISTAEVEANCAKYGRLYDWATALKACPAGYRLASDEEWTALVDYAGGKETAGTKLKSAVGWNEDGNGTNDFGWSALPGGFGYGCSPLPGIAVVELYRSINEDVEFDYDYAGNFGFWWSATEYDADAAWSRLMYYDFEFVDRGDSYKTRLYSVRCVQNKEGEQ